MSKKSNPKQKTDGLPFTVFGIIIITVSLGSTYSVHLAQYSYFILIAASFFLIHAANVIVARWNRKKEITDKNYIAGLIGVLLSILLLGIQSPQFMFKKFALYIGIAMVFYGYYKSK